MKGKKKVLMYFWLPIETMYRNVVMFLFFKKKIQKFIEFAKKNSKFSQKCKILHQKKLQGIHEA